MSARNSSLAGYAAVALAALLLTGCSRSPHTQEPAPQPLQASGATSFTTALQAAVAARLPLTQPQDFEDVRRGLIGREENLVIRSAEGKPIWDVAQYAFEQGEAPASVNPSLWRQALLNREHGLFQVAEGIYQVRGYDIANLSLIRSRSGWIVVDPLTARETAAAAMALARKHLGDLRIVAIVFTHSHIDHFGGVAAVLPEDAAARAQVQILAPRGFMEEATSENVLAGMAMGRRASFMYGTHLPRHPQGHVDSGLGKSPAVGEISIAEPTDLIERSGEERTIDGVRFVFQYTPDSEAPAELTFYLPEAKAFCAAEVATHNMHNLYTLRGAKVRDALKWSGYLDDAIERFPDQEVVFASHHWPVWGNVRALDFLKSQRDTYKYIHDQTLRLANAGLTAQEIAEELQMPESLDTAFASRGYYGTLRHNSKAVYQNYFGWFDGNPANLDPLPPVPAAAKYVEAMGGAAAVLAKGQAAYDAGEYRWAATLLNHLVFLQPNDKAARELLARTYEQLGYQAESGPWRDFYLTGAVELRNGPGGSSLRLASATAILQHMPAARFFDSMAVRVIGPKAQGKKMSFNFVFTDIGESHRVILENGVLHHKQKDPDPSADATVRISKALLVRLATKQAGLKETIFSDELSVEGSRLTLLSFFSLLDDPDGNFAIVTP